MHIRLLLILLLAADLVMGQHKKGGDSIPVDLLRAPVSPAANLAGIAPSEIEKPTDAAAFMISLQQATNQFSQLPKSYAVDFTPGLLFNARNLTIDKYLLNNFKDNFKQSFTLSAAVRNLDANEEDSLLPRKTRLALGFKFSALRGRLEDKASELLLGIRKLQSIIVNEAGDKIDSMADEDIVYRNARNNMRLVVNVKPGETVDSVAYYHWQSVAQERKEAITRSVFAQYSNHLSQIKTRAAAFKITRVGWKLDAAGGLAIDFFGTTFFPQPGG